MSLLPKKGFCDIYEGAEPLHIVLKRDPMEAEFLRPVHVCIQPGYHCNKRQGNSVYPDGTLPDEEIKVMLQTSCDLVRGKRKGEGE